MAEYPGDIKAFTDKVDGVDTYAAADVNELQDEVNAIETGLIEGLQHPLICEDVVEANAGIAFPAVQVPSVDVNTLDDYEEGTWTPDLQADSGAGVTYSFTRGFYTKVGRLVFVVGEFQLTDKGTLAGNLKLAGLPFVCTANQHPALTVSFFANLLLGIVNLVGRIVTGAQYAELGFNEAASSALDQLAAEDIDDTFTLYFSGCYLAAA